MGRHFAVARRSLVKATPSRHFSTAFHRSTQLSPETFLFLMTSCRFQSTSNFRLLPAIARASQSTNSIVFAPEFSGVIS